MVANIFYRITLLIALSFASISANADYTFNLLDSLAGNVSGNGMGLYDFFGASVPDNFISVATDINASGQIVGFGHTSDGYIHGTIWNNGVVTDLGTLDPGGTSAAFGINASGQVVGGSTFGVSSGPNASGQPHTVIWNNGVATDISAGPYGGIYSWGRGLNASGQIIGVSTSSSNSNLLSAATWNNGLYSSLVPLGSEYTTYSSTYGINASGQIVGGVISVNGNTQPQATIWNNGVATVLGDGVAFGINDSGQVVGTSNSRATIWNNGVATVLGDGVASDINNSGQVVGFHFFGNRAMLWSNGVAVDLNSMLDASSANAGWVLESAIAINDNGWIVGQASNSLLGISSQAFVLAAVPESDTSAMLLMGAGLMGFMARRRKNNQV